MVAVYRNGKWIDDSEDQSLQPSPAQPAAAMPVYGQTPVDAAVAEYEQQQQQERAQLDQEYQKQLASGGDDRPFWAPNPGAAISDTFKIATNALFSVPTDLLDLAAGVGDVAVQTGSLISGNGWDWSQVMNDADNPWTVARRNAFKTESQAGQAVSNLVRIGVAFITLPKAVTSIGTKGLAALGGANDIEKGVKAAGMLEKLGQKSLQAITGFAKASSEAQQSATAGRAIATAAKGFARTTPGAKALDIAAKDKWLFATLQDVSASVSKAPELSGISAWASNVQESARALTQLNKGSSIAKIRTVGEALAWDAFVAFNVFGEGDSQMDETLGDLAASSNMPWLRAIGAPTATMAEDSGLIRKAKQLAEGLVTGAAVSAAIDTWRVYRYAKNFRKAGPEEQRAILEAMNASAQDIGNSIGKSLPSTPALPFGVDDAPAGLLPGVASEAQRLRQLDSLYEQLSQVRSNPEANWAASRANDAAPWRQPGQPRLPGGPEDLNSPVQNRLAQMEGVASQLDLNDDPLYQQWLASKAPAEAFMPPGTGENPALAQFQRQGPMPQPEANDLPAYRAWLEAKARMPEGELDPRVQQSLRRLDQIGELVPSPGGQLAAGGEVAGGEPGLAGLLPGGPEAKPPGAPPAGLLGAGGPPVSAGIEPVRVSEVRPPEPAVTPQTIRQAFEADAFSAWKEAQELTLEQSADGVFRSVAQKVEQLMPRTRVDAMEYLKTFHPMTNQYGVINASDSVWTNFLYEKALAEGWASIDPETMAVRFNRTSALQLDRADVAIVQAESLDEIRYQEWLWNKEAVNGSPQMRPEVQENLGKMEARDQYDAWEGQQKQQREQVNNSYDAWEKQQSGERLLQQQADETAFAAQQFDNAERQRLAEAAARQLSGDLTDEQAVREFTGSTVDSIEPPTVQKAEGGRGWDVFDRNGELLGQARTKAAAQKLADQQAARDRDALIGKARQLEADSVDQVMGQPIGGPVYDGNVMGKIQLTDAQIRAVQGISPQLDSLLDEAWVARRGGSAFFNLDQLGAQKRTFEIEQGDMLALQDALRSAIQSAGALKGSQRLRALKNLADKLDTQIKLLEPQARAKRFADSIIADTEQFIKHGEHCDFF